MHKFRMLTAIAFIVGLTVGSAVAGVVDAIRAEPMTQYLGMSSNELLRAVGERKTVSDPNAHEIKQTGDMCAYRFPADGIEFFVQSGKVIEVCCHLALSGNPPDPKYKTYAGRLPLGLKPGQGDQEVRDSLGFPDYYYTASETGLFVMLYYAGDRGAEICFRVGAVATLDRIGFLLRPNVTPETEKSDEETKARLYLQSMSRKKTKIINVSIGKTWGFVTLQRASGAEIVFSLQGAAAGLPANGSYPLRLKRDGDCYELRELETGNTYRYGPDGSLAEVRTAVKEREFRMRKANGAWGAMEEVKTNAEEKSGKP